MFRVIGSNTAIKTVISADSSSGASTNPTSSGRRRLTSKIRAMLITAVSAAVRKAPTMVALVATMVTAEPPAFGALAETSSTNRRNASLLLAACFGTTCTLARPSGKTQSFAISGGMLPSDTGWASSARLSCRSSCGRKRVNMSFTCSALLSSAWLRRRRSSAIVANGLLGGFPARLPGESFAKARSIGFSASSAAWRICGAVGGIAMSCGATVVASRLLASPTMASFFS